MENNTILIDRYLQNEMSGEERAAFEIQLKTDKALQEELRVQKLLTQAAIDTGVKSEFAKAIQKKIMIRKITQWVVIGTIVVGAFVFYAIKSGMFSAHGFTEARSRGNEPVEQFEIDNTKDTIIETKDGVVFAIPAAAFKGGDNIRLEIQTALTAHDIMEKGLSTMSNGSLLQTAGMFYINGYVGEKPAKLVKDIAVSVPATNANPNMQLFDGVEDASGNINWVNPKPIAKDLRTYDITSLDFYPPDYIPVLKALKKPYANKRYTDSLYYSFSGYPFRDLPTKDSGSPDVIDNDYNINPGAEGEDQGIGDESNYQKNQHGQTSVDPVGDKNNGRIIFNARCASCHILGKDATGPNLNGVISRWNGNMEHVKAWVKNWNNAVKAGYPRALQVQQYDKSVMTAFDGILDDAQLEAVIKFADSSQPRNVGIYQDSSGKSQYQIDPAKIKALWDKKFNNTIIATKEFEERLRYIHSIANGEATDLLDIYLRNLDKPLYVSDEECAKRSSNSVSHQFDAFAQRKDGSVMITTDVQEKLSDYFQKRSAAFREASIKTWQKHEAELVRLKNIAEERRTEQSHKDLERQEKLFGEELCINLTDAYRQIGVRRTCNDTIPTLPPANNYNIIINTTGWKNLDLYVLDATTTRESMSYTDPETGKTATLTYKPMTVRVEQQATYDRVLVYLIPDSLSSFQKVEQSGESFKESLNALFRYDLIILGYKGDEAFYFRQQNIQAGEHSFSLALVTKQALRPMLKNYDKGKAKEWKQEYEYQLAEQREMNRVVQVQKEYEFREMIASAIFCCLGWEGSFDYLAPESTPVNTEMPLRPI